MVLSVGYLNVFGLFLTSDLSPLGAVVCSVKATRFTLCSLFKGMFRPKTFGPLGSVEPGVGGRWIDNDSVIWSHMILAANCQCQHSTM
eukprot:3575012-Amphidinium_carterae.2